MPATSSGMRTASRSGSGIACSARSITSPTVSVLSTVPRPGRCRSGIHSTRMASPTRMTTVPTLKPALAAMPWCRTSYGLTPSRAWSVSAIPTPSTGMPTSSCGSRRRSSRHVGTVTTSSEVSRAACPPMGNRSYTPSTRALHAGAGRHCALRRLEALRCRWQTEGLRERGGVAGLGAADAHGRDVEALVGERPHRRLVRVGEDRFDVERAPDDGHLVAEVVDDGLQRLHHDRVRAFERRGAEIPGRCFKELRVLLVMSAEQG